ncbi:MAG: ACT domain-containing protein [Actinomycetota bacterium]|nr:ACT domain-containing protein [Actinomycetota bacterium]
MTHFAVTAVGADRPGIVSAVSKAFVDHGCNIEDSAMTILRGQFAMMLVIAAPAEVRRGDLESALADPAADLDLVVTVQPLLGGETGPDQPVSARETWTVSVHGADRPGIVNGVADVLARTDVNIIDLSTRVVGEAASPVYVMILEVQLPPSLDPGELGARLHEVAQALGVSANLHPSEADIL